MFLSIFIRFNLGGIGINASLTVLHSSYCACAVHVMAYRTLWIFTMEPDEKRKENTTPYNNHSQRRYTNTVEHQWNSSKNT